MSNKKFKVTLSEDELKAVIMHNMQSMYNSMNVETSARIHDLTKRLNKETPESEEEKTPAISETANPVNEPQQQPWG